MSDPRPLLDYRNPSPPLRARWTDGQCAFFAAACCFGCSWLAWFVVGIVSIDPFDDDAVLLALFFLAVPGTLCGLILSPIVVIIVVVFRPGNDRP